MSILPDFEASAQPDLLPHTTFQPSSAGFLPKFLSLPNEDPYVRAHYFLARYGSLEALYFALARGKLLTPRVLDILIASGAHLSRYLVQVAFHHFFHSQSHFLKPSAPWARQVPLATFSHFLNLAADKYGDIPRGKNEDDGSLFATFIKESKFPAESQRVSWETIRDIFENYHFMPFCPRDPLMAQFPLALAIEPRLLPYAVANGFQMDAKYRDFVFRKMFEHTAAPAAAHTDEIVANVRELCRLDPDMFVTRTVAAEVCLEAKTNQAAYGALKQLDRAGDLPFTLRELVQDVIKLYSKARAITTSATTQLLTQLYTDFLAPPPIPAALASSSRAHSNSRALIDPTVRRAMLLTVFAAEPPIGVSAMPARLAPLRLGPLSIKDAADVLLSAFVEKHAPLIEYMRREGVASGESAEGTRKPTPAELRTLAEEVAVRCLTRESKGRTLKRLCEAYPTVRGRIIQAVLDDHEVKMEGLGKAAEGVEPWRAQLARGSLGGIVSEMEGSDSEWDFEEEESDEDENEDDELDSDSEMSDGSMSESGDGNAGKTKLPAPELGRIGLETLSAMIRRDEQGGRGRRRYYPMIYGTSLNTTSRVLPDSMSVARWIKSEFGAYSSVTARYLMHALINGNHSVLSTYLATGSVPVPITLQHFQVLAKLGSPCVDFYMYERIKQGAPFYATENDYLAGADSARLKKIKGKGREGAPAPGTPPRVKTEPDVKVEVTSSPPRGKKRPRRSATVVSSYAVPGSDDEAIADEEDLNGEFAEFRMPGGGLKRKVAKVERVETSLEAWTKALGVLLKEEQRKYREKKKRVDKEKAAGSGEKIRLCKSDFFRSLTTNLRALRELDAQKRMFRAAAGDEVPESDGEDDEYVQQKAKRRKTVTTA
ncbi:hypothetical protein C8F04DRAFT_1389517 [Mycena alexandri]|uniref:Uncharacterized protein n=1 Tax=Mycena alexandri TaxID=1745969 RepID=A0AAD6XD98_9AGAR|nr:hypothetical protein C8F04DRAFT_1389517 [Mycena alexandri]